MSRRRRALLLGGLALVLGGLAAFDVAGREAALDRRVGGLVDVVVASEPIAAGTPIRPGALAIRRVPERFAPRRRIAVPRSLAGLRAAVDIGPGTDLTETLVGDGDGAANATGPAIRRGERVAEVVALGPPGLVVAGSRVDVLVTPEPGSGEAEVAVVALEDVEVLDAVAIAADGTEPEGRDGAAGPSAASGARVAASLRVSLRQAVYLAAAQDFARALRLLPRSGGDRRRGAAGLRMGVRSP